MTQIVVTMHISTLMAQSFTGDTEVGIMGGPSLHSTMESGILWLSKVTVVPLHTVASCSSTHDLRAYWKRVDVRKALLKFLFATILLSELIPSLASSPSEVNSRSNGYMITQSNGIIVNGTDYNSTFTFVYSAHLLNITEDITSRIVAEYGEFVVKKDLYAPVGLPPIPPRIIVEYADTVLQLVLQSPPRINLSDRVIVEYADYAVRLNLSGWKPWDVNADGKVNIVDVSIVARRFGSVRDGLNWDGRCDLDLNGVINIVDVSVAARHFGEIGIDP
jgi:hypothetical protein